MYYQTQGIILRSENYRESDRTYTIYTEKYGKMRAVAKGVRKIKSKLAGHLEPFSLTNLMIVKGKIVDKIINAVAIDSFKNLKEDLEKIAWGTYVLEVVDSLTREHHRDRKIFNLLKETLTRLKNLEAGKPRSFFIIHISYFIIHLLFLLGYKPELYQCVHCKKNLASNFSSDISCPKTHPEFVKGIRNIFFSPKLGGLLCPLCKKFDQNSLAISQKSIEILREMLSMKSPSILPKDEVEKIIDSFLKYRLDRELKTEKFIQICRIGIPISL